MTYFLLYIKVPPPSLKKKECRYFNMKIILLDKIILFIIITDFSNNVIRFSENCFGHFPPAVENLHLQLSKRKSHALTFSKPQPLHSKDAASVLTVLVCAMFYT